ncbi:c-type cytochrome [Palleronia sp.]|uniref:c-type cytochrome n=1 Tax=Palleronia sp. TaxID=1940284 RepID=UPI0035C84C92
MRPTLLFLAALVAAGAVVAWFVTAPNPLPAAEVEGLEGDAERGAALFTQAGCASCHVASGVSEGDGAPVLAGGMAFETRYGTFHAPNISPSSQGIGDWSDTDLVNAIARGISPSGSHYYPALPYTSYENAELQDLVDIVAHLRTLPESDAASLPHDLSFPFNIRRTLGGWKMLYANRGWVMDEPASAEVERGRYLVEALFHCGQCHTPRTALGGMDRDRWLQGAPNPDGQGRIPGITPGQIGWSDADLAAYLKTGLTPDFDSAGGQMAAVVRHLNTLPGEDIAAIVAYLRAVPAAEETGTE